MFDTPSSHVERRLNGLEKHLKQENPVLLQVVQSFRELDSIAYRMGILERTESFATRVPWWPMISILGTFSSGKSTFINHFLGHKLQRTGNQAVDDKFTVICYSKEENIRTLPGLALDADPRFPFYQISKELERVSPGEGQRIDAYLQLKTCPTEKLRGKILIDSPGFDADAQRNATLQITDHIMDLSDLVLVFFDARHPEPGAMKDTLDHLVKNTINRSDSNKFLFILNQVDCTVREDNLEDIVAAWQRALAQSGLTAGHFYQIYNKEAAYVIEDPQLRERYENKLQVDMADLQLRIQRVEVERAYRIIGVLEHTAKLIHLECVPRLRDWVARWRKAVLTIDAILYGLIAVGVASGIMVHNPPLASWLDIGLWAEGSTPWQSVLVDFLAATGTIALLSVHMLVRKWTARFMSKGLLKEVEQSELREYMRKGFLRNTGPLASVFRKQPVGWGRLAQMKLMRVLKSSDSYVQNLNDQFTNPSGRSDVPNPKVMLEVN
ncbi:MAG: dynamin family protein [Magnetococcales bacterium]|nr:dynamin family protein [Magnetococcales bacterium]MBF0113854.1 dynamin family protein [Magnetococcales bacterium]